MPGKTGGDAKFISASEHQRHQAGSVDQTGVGQHGGNFAGVAIDFPEACGNRNFIGERFDQVVEHRGHQCPLLLGQTVARIEKEIATYGGQAAWPTRTRGVDQAVGCIGSNRPFLGHHHILK